MEARRRSKSAITACEPGLKVIPEVSRQVWIPFCLAFSKSSVTKPICIRGSPAADRDAAFFIEGAGLLVLV